MKETLKPIDLEKPLCGLGEDYEESKVWTSRRKTWQDHEVPNVPDKYGICFVSRAAAEPHNGADRSYTLPEVTAKARFYGFIGVAVLDANLSVVESWPV